MACTELEEPLTSYGDAPGRAGVDGAEGAAAAAAVAGFMACWAAPTIDGP